MVQIESHFNFLYLLHLLIIFMIQIESHFNFLYLLHLLMNIVNVP